MLCNFVQCGKKKKLRSCTTYMLWKRFIIISRYIYNNKDIRKKNIKLDHTQNMQFHNRFIFLFIIDET